MDKEKPTHKTVEVFRKRSILFIKDKCYWQCSFFYDTAGGMCTRCSLYDEDLKGMRYRCKQCIDEYGL